MIKILIYLHHHLIHYYGQPHQHQHQAVVIVIVIIIDLGLKPRRVVRTKYGPNSLLHDKGRLPLNIQDNDITSCSTMNEDSCITNLQGMRLQCPKTCVLYLEDDIYYAAYLNNKSNDDGNVYGNVYGNADGDGDNGDL
jgi:hypothetical protein